MPPTFIVMAESDGSGGFGGGGSPSFRPGVTGAGDAMRSVHAVCVVESGESGVLGVFCNSQFAILVDGSYTRRPQCAAFLAHAGCGLVVPARTPPLGSLLLPAPRPSAHQAAPDLALLWRCIRQLQTRITHNTHSRRRPIDPLRPAARSARRRQRRRRRRRRRGRKS